jgi:CO/xanthine dehydrogenase Mo-binding subunit
VRIIQTVTGGGFGGKEEYPSMIAGHAALLAWKSARPVKLVYDRLEDLAATTKRHPAVIRTRFGVKRDGTLLAQEIDIIMDGGAYVTLSPVVLSRGVLHAAGPYRCPNVFMRARSVATNTPPNGAFRGFGAPQTEFATECHMDQVARALKMDPIELRRVNAYTNGDITPTGQVLHESVGTHEVLERTIKRSDFKRKQARYARENARAEGAERRGRTSADGRRVRRGIGLSLVYHGSGFTGAGEVMLDSRVALELTADGRPRVLAANTEIGQGTATIYPQLVGDALGVPPEFVELEVPDTALVPNSGPTVASRSCMVVGGLLSRCGQAMRQTLEEFTGRPIEGADDFRRVARSYLRKNSELRLEQRYEKPPEISWNEDTYQGDAYGVYSYACCAVELEVDLDTFETEVLRVTTAQDVGKAIHPVLVEGQIQGGTVQALGYALLEEIRWQNGRVWNHQLTNYIIPTTMDTPEIDVEIVEIPYSHGPHGAKGVGELPMDAPAPAVVNAILDATGVLVPGLPVSPERLRVAWQETKAQQRRVRGRRRHS